MPELVLVRHGETVGQSSIRLYGATDVALAPEGERQVAAAGRALAGISFDAVYTSPLQRARRSAEVVLASIPHPPIELEIVEGFREINFGRWEGWTWPEVEARDPEGHARWATRSPEFCFPDGEARAEFVARVQAAVEPSLAARLAHGGVRALAVVHKGVIKAIVARLLGVGFAELDGLALPLGAVRRMRTLDDGRWLLDPHPEDRPRGNLAAGSGEPPPTSR